MQTSYQTEAGSLNYTPENFPVMQAPRIEVGYMRDNISCINRFIGRYITSKGVNNEQKRPQTSRNEYSGVLGSVAKTAFSVYADNSQKQTGVINYRNDSQTTHIHGNVIVNQPPSVQDRRKVKEEEKRDTALLVAIGSVAVGAILSIAYFVGGDFTTLKSAKNSEKKAEDINTYIRQFNALEDQNYTVMETISNKTLDLAKKVRRLTLVSQILPKAVILTGSASLLYGALKDSTRGLHGGIAIVVAGLAGLLFARTYYSEDLQEIKDEAKLIKQNIDSLGE